MRSCISSPTSTPASRCSHRGPLDPSRARAPAARASGIMREPDDAVPDALRLSRGMSYKNAMAGLPIGGGKAVILADAIRTKTPGDARRLGRAVDGLGGAYVTAEDVGISVADLVAVAKQTRYVSGLPVGRGPPGGDPGPSHQLWRLPWRQGRGEARSSARTASPASISPSRAPAASPRASPAAPRAEGARLTIADVDQRQGEALAGETRAARSSRRRDHDASRRTCSAPYALGAILTETSIAALNVPIVAGGANNQLATRADGDRIHAARHPLRARLCDQRGRDHQRRDRISRRRATGRGPRSGSSRSRAGSSRSGRRASSRPAAIRRPRSPKRWPQRVLDRPRPDRWPGSPRARSLRRGRLARARARDRAV